MLGFLASTMSPIERSALGPMTKPMVVLAPPIGYEPVPDGHGARELPPCSWLSATEPAGSLPNFLSSLWRMSRSCRYGSSGARNSPNTKLVSPAVVKRVAISSPFAWKTNMMRRGVIAAWARAARGRIASSNGSASATPEAPRSSVRREMRFGAGERIDGLHGVTPR